MCGLSDRRKEGLSGLKEAPEFHFLKSASVSQMEKSLKKVAAVAPVIRERKCPLLNDPSREGFSLSAGSLGHKKGRGGNGERLASFN